MTIQFGANTHTTFAAAQPDAFDAPLWQTDIAKHQDQTSERQQAVHRQTYLMEYIRIGCAQPCRKGAFTTSANGTPVTEQQVAPAQGSIEAAQQELIDLDNRILDIDEHLGKLESRILMHEPHTTYEAAAQLSFLAALLADGKKIGPGYVADIIGHASGVFARMADTSDHRFLN